MIPLPIEVEAAVIKYATEHYGEGEPPALVGGSLSITLPATKLLAGFDVSTLGDYVLGDYTTHTIGVPELLKIIAGLSCRKY